MMFVSLQYSEPEQVCKITVGSAKVVIKNVLTLSETMGRGWFQAEAKPGTGGGGEETKAVPTSILRPYLVFAQLPAASLSLALPAILSWLDTLPVNRYQLPGLDGQPVTTVYTNCPGWTYNLVTDTNCPDWTYNLSTDTNCPGWTYNLVTDTNCPGWTYNLSTNTNCPGWTYICQQNNCPGWTYNLPTDTNCPGWT